jgi:cytochrome c biogenesis protein CcmG/thiol:disulfide interchange protein DsbE
MPRPTKRRSSITPTTLVMIIAGVVTLIVTAVVVIVVATGGGDDEVSAGTEQARPVEVAGVSLPLLEDEANDPAVGIKAPVIRGASFDGTPISTDPGQPTLVVLVAHWCPHCQAEVPRIVDTMASGALPDDLRVVAISTSVSSAQPNYPPSEWLDREGWAGEVIADDAENRASRALGLVSFPTTILLDAEGNVMWRYAGELPDGQLEQLVNTSLAA